MTAEQLRNSLLQEAISGRLVPQDPNDKPACELLLTLSQKKEQLLIQKKYKPKDFFSKSLDSFEPKFELPKGWEWVRLNFVANIARGGSPRPIKEYLTTRVDGINWIKIGDTEKGGKYINQTAEKIKPEGVKKSRLISPGDFLLTNSMSFGRPYISNVEGCIHDGWLVISQYTETFDKDYLYYLLSSPYTYEQFCDVVSGAVVKNLNSDKVAESVFPLPPLAEQKRIVAKLEELLPIVEEYGKSQKDLEILNAELPARLRQSVLQEAISGRLLPQDSNDEPVEELLDRIKQLNVNFSAFYNTSLEWEFDIPSSWKWVKLGALSEEIKRGKSPVYVSHSNYIAFAQKCNTKKGKIDLGLAKYIDEKQALKYQKLYLREGHIIVNSTGTGTLGRIGIFDVPIPKDIKGIIPDSHVAVIRLFLVEPKYIFYYLKTCQNYLESKGEGGTNQKELKPSIIANLPVPLPPLAEQQRIVAKLEEILPQIDKLGKL